jgi:hypothetical protein
MSGGWKITTGGWKTATGAVWDETVNSGACPAEGT